MPSSPAALALWSLFGQMHRCPHFASSFIRRQGLLAKCHIRGFSRGSPSSSCKSVLDSSHHRASTLVGRRQCFLLSSLYRSYSGLQGSIPPIKGCISYYTFRVTSSRTSHSAQTSVELKHRSAKCPCRVRYCRTRRCWRRKFLDKVPGCSAPLRFVCTYT